VLTENPEEQDQGWPDSCFLDINEIRESLNGVARVLEYTVVEDEDGPTEGKTMFKAKNLEVTSIIEGELKNGQLEGFSRSIESQGRCQVGFNSAIMSSQLRGGKLLAEQRQIPRPHGKWVQYGANGTFLSVAGIYRGDEQDWNRCIKPKEITDFYANEEPTLTFGQSFGDWLGACCMCSNSSNLDQVDKPDQESLIRPKRRQDIKKLRGKI